MLRAKRHLLTGDPMSAEDGYAMGLVTDLVEETRRRIASLGPEDADSIRRAVKSAPV